MKHFHGFGVKYNVKYNVLTPFPVSENLPCCFAAYLAVTNNIVNLSEMNVRTTKKPVWDRCTCIQKFLWDLPVEDLCYLVRRAGTQYKTRVSVLQQPRRSLKRISSLITVNSGNFNIV